MMKKENALHSKLLVLNYARSINCDPERLYTLGITTIDALHRAINVRGGLVYALYGDRFQRVLDGCGPLNELDAVMLVERMVA